MADLQTEALIQEVGAARFVPPVDSVVRLNRAVALRHVAGAAAALELTRNPAKRDLLARRLAGAR